MHNEWLTKATGVEQEQARIAAEPVKLTMAILRISPSYAPTGLAKFPCAFLDDRMRHLRRPVCRTQTTFWMLPKSQCAVREP